MASSTEASGSNGAADPFIGSLISLTSKCEIRYEGILYNINTEESSIGLINVKSYGTEGRKKDGQQVPPSDKVYEYILFRGSNIKDLQVKVSPPVQSALPIQNDPAIMQSQYSRAPPVSTSLPSAASGSVADPSSHTTQIAVPRSTLQGDVPLYQPGGSLGSWGSSPSNVDGSGLAMPMYWPGFYGPSNGFSHAQQSFFQSPSGMSMPHSMQHPTYPGGSAPILTGSSYLPASSVTTSNLPTPNLPASNLGESTPPLLPPFSIDSVNLASSSPQYTLLYPALHTAVASAVSPSPESNLASSTVTMPAPIAPDTNAGLRPFYPHLYTPAQHAAMFSLTSQSQMSNMASNIVPSTILPCASLPLASQPTSSALDKTSPILSLPFQTMPHSASPFVGTFGSVNTETSKPSLVTPGQLLHPGPTTLSSSMLSDPVKKDVEVVQATSSKSPPSALVIAQVPSTSTSTSVTTQAPILPLPSPANQKLNGPPFHTHNSHTGRVRERGRGNGFSRPVTRFTEDFDFMAMNEKFKKDEVWGDLGKANKTKYNEDHGIEDDGNISEAANDTESLKLEKPVYVKDDFFDSLSCRSLNNGQRNGRFKFSELRKIDSETFGNVPRHWGGRGGWWPGSGGRSRGPYYGRGYGNVGRGQGY